MQKLVNDYDLLKAYKQGLNAQEYAGSTGISVFTIEHHLIKLAEIEALKPEDIAGDDTPIIADVLLRANWDGTITKAFHLLEGRYSYIALNMLLRSPSFLRRITDNADVDAAWKTKYLCRLQSIEKKRSQMYMQIPGTFVYFIFDKEDENTVLFIDVTTNLGKTANSCKTTASKIGYIEVSSKEEGRTLAAYYTAGMKPRYPSHNADDNVILSIDEKKRKPGIIRFNSEN